MVIHASAAIGPPTSSLQRRKFFNNASYLIGGLEFSLNDIENGECYIIRNRWLKYIVSVDSMQECCVLTRKLLEDSSSCRLQRAIRGWQSH